MQHKKYISGKQYKPLDIDFVIPDFLQGEIDLYIDDLNNHNGTSNDLFSEEIEYYIKWCDNLITKDQKEQLKLYYCDGGIFNG